MLLSTKFFVPRPGDPTVRRTRLFEKLSAGLQTRLTLISATAGFGKTTAIASWLHYLRVQHGNAMPSVAWLTLDESDNDPVRFFAYLLGAFQHIHPTLGANLQHHLQTHQSTGWQALLIALINEVSQQTSDFLLVLDDYHFIATQEIQQAMIFFIENLPPNLHILVTTRSDPPWSLARWRVRRYVVDIRAADLRFSHEEIEAYLRQTVGTVSRDDIHALEQRTEGWIAGLQLAALPLADEENPSAFIHAFSGSQRYVMDYLVEEVLQRQPEMVQNFLLQTSILDRLCPALCSALLAETQITSDDATCLPRSSANDLLESLMQANLFLIALDDERRWYRYHHLFADVLQARLRQIQPERVAILHERAAHWFLAQNLSDEAIHHAFAAGNNELAASMVEQQCDNRLRKGQQITLFSWLDHLPQTVVATHPRLALAQARLLVIVHKLDQAENALENATKAIAALPDNQQNELFGQVAAIEAGIALNRGDYQRASNCAMAALSQLDKDDAWRGDCLLHLGLSSSALGDLEGASRAYGDAVVHSKKFGDLRTTLVAMFNQGATLHSAGHLRRAAQQYEATIEYAQACGGQQMPATAYAYQSLGELWLEWNDFEKAKHYLDEAKLRNELGGQNRMLCLTLLNFARLDFAQGKLDLAQQSIRQANQLIQDHQLPLRYALPIEGFQVRLWLAQGDVRSALEWSNRHESSPKEEPLRLIHEERYLALARTLAAHNRTSEALALLNRYRQQMVQEGRGNSVMTAVVLQSLLLCQTGEQKKAGALLCEQLDLIESEGYTRIFVDEGEAMARMLRKLHSQLTEKRQQRTVARLLSLFTENQPVSPTTMLIARQSVNGTQPMSQSTSAAQDAPIALVEPLSEREVEILHVVAEGLSDRQIAERLIIAIGTVKKHLNNVYGKLGVGNRTGALARARELGLIA